MTWSHVTLSFPDKVRMSLYAGYHENHKDDPGHDPCCIGYFSYTCTQMPDKKQLMGGREGEREGLFWLGVQEKAARHAENVAPGSRCECSCSDPFFFHSFYSVWVFSPPHGVTHIQGRSSLLSYIPLATASQVHSEVHFLGDSKLSRAGNED